MCKINNINKYQTGMIGGGMVARKNSENQKAQNEEIKKSKRKEAMKMLMWCATLPPFNHDDPEQVKARVALYFDKCMNDGFTPGKEGLCNALHITRQTFQTWLNGTARKGQEHQKICQDAEQVLKSYIEMAMLDGDINPVPGIFIMSNQYDYVQKQVVAQQQTVSILDSATPEQLEHRYGEGMIIDAIYSERAERKEISNTGNKDSVKPIMQKSKKELQKVKK